MNHEKFCQNFCSNFNDIFCHFALIWTVTGTHKGPSEIPPTGRIIKGNGISVIHFEDGKIKLEWPGNNNLQWLMQLGFTLVPPSQETRLVK